LFDKLSGINDELNLDAVLAHRVHCTLQKKLHIAMWARVSLFRRFTDTNVQGKGSVKIRKTRHKISVDVRIFLQCRLQSGARSDEVNRVKES